MTTLTQGPYGSVHNTGIWLYLLVLIDRLKAVQSITLSMLLFAAYR